MIEQLKKNQLALTYGFENLIASNRDVLTLNEMPKIEGEEITIASLENRFGQEEKDILENFGLPKPGNLMKMS